MSDLIDLEASIQSSLEDGSNKDPEFSAAVLKRIGPHKARAELRDIHNMMLARQRVKGITTDGAVQRSGWRDEVSSSD